MRVKDEEQSNMTADKTTTPTSPTGESACAKVKMMILYFSLYLAGIFTFLIIIAEPFTLNTYFSDNSLLPGLANREFYMMTEAEYNLKALEKLTENKHSENQVLSLATLPKATSYIKNELYNYGLEVYEQNFSYKATDGGQRHNGTNIYSIIRGERSTSSESLTLCAPFKKNSKTNTLSSVALSMALAKYFSSRSYWAKDVIVLFVDRDEYGLSAWLDSYYDIRFRSNVNKMDSFKDGIYYDSLPERSGPMQAAIVLELMGRNFAKINIKIQGMYGQLPNLDLFNLAVELASRESVTPYFHDKSLPYGLNSDLDLYKHNLETAISFMKNQATMQSDGLHGHFSRYAIQSLTIEAPEHDARNQSVLVASLLNVGRMIEGMFRSLNNLTERFNRSFYFYIIVSLRRFTSIGYYMIAFGLLIAPVLLKVYRIHQNQAKLNKLFIGFRGVFLLGSALALSLISTFNISAALIGCITLVPILLII